MHASNAMQQHQSRGWVLAGRTVSSSSCVLTHVSSSANITHFTDCGATHSHAATATARHNKQIASQSGVTQQQAKVWSAVRLARLFTAAHHAKARCPASLATWLSGCFRYHNRP